MVWGGSHLLDGAVLSLGGPHPPLVEEVEGDEERGAQRGHGGGQGDGDVAEENHRCEGVGEGGGRRSTGAREPWRGGLLQGCR